MSEASNTKNRKNLVLLFSIGLVPVVIAYVVYVFFPHLLPTTTTNQGQLITPPISNEVIGLALTSSKWSLLIPVDISCDDLCEQRLYLSRQVNVALGKETERVKRILLVSHRTDSLVVSTLSGKYRDMEIAEVEISTLRETLKPAVGELKVEDLIFLMDPNGNIMMFYTLEKAGKGMLRDLKHLLKISNIG